MRFSTSVIALTLASIAVGSTIPVVKRATIDVSSDEGTVSVTIPDPASNLALTEATGPERGANVADAVVTIINAVLSIVDGISNDINARKQFTQQTVARVRSETGLNVVMSNVGYTFTGTPVSVSSTKFNAKIGADVSFDVVTFETGSFLLQGDGGFQNWAFIVDGTCASDAKAKTIAC